MHIFVPHVVGSCHGLQLEMSVYISAQGLQLCLDLVGRHVFTVVEALAVLQFLYLFKSGLAVALYHRFLLLFVEQSWVLLQALTPRLICRLGSLPLFHSGSQACSWLSWFA